MVVANVKAGKDAYGYNARADKYEDMFKAGIIDPTKVARVALENAASIAAMFLTTECVLVDKKEENPAPGHAAGHGWNGQACVVCSFGGISDNQTGAFPQRKAACFFILGSLRRPAVSLSRTEQCSG